MFEEQIKVDSPNNQEVSEFIKALDCPADLLARACHKALNLSNPSF